MTGWQSAVTTSRMGLNGLWLSKAGRDAKTATERDLLLSTDHRNFSFVVNGVVFLTVKTSATVVLYGSVLSNRPVPITQIIHRGQSLVPVYQLINGRTPDSFLSALTDTSYGSHTGPFGYVRADKDRLNFVNEKNLAYYLRFLVSSVKGYD